MAYFPSSASGPAILGELLAAATSQNAMAWRTSPAGTELELRVLEWFRDMLGLPTEFHGHIVDTASIATMLALAAAREAHSELHIRTEGMAGRSDLKTCCEASQNLWQVGFGRFLEVSCQEISSVGP